MSELRSHGTVALRALPRDHGSDLDRELHGAPALLESAAVELRAFELYGILMMRVGGAPRADKQSVCCRRSTFRRRRHAGERFDRKQWQQSSVEL
jgi:hypothetical protein